MSNKTVSTKDLDKTENITTFTETENPREIGGVEYLIDDSQELLLKAQKDAELAKAVARQAISRAFQQSEATIKQADVLAKAFDDALQGNFSETTHRENSSITEPIDREYVKPGRVKKMQGNGQNPLNIITEMTRSIFNNKAVDTETKADFYNTVIRQSKQLREFIDELVSQQVQKRIDKALEEAKSDRIASKLVVQQAREEVSQAREEAENARKDAEEAINIAREWIEQAKDEVAAEKRSAEVKTSRAQQQAMREAQSAIKQAQDEVAAAKEAADIAIKRAEAEAQQARKEADESRNKARIDIGLAQEKARQEIEKVERIKHESQIIIDEALAEAARARDEVKAARQESQEAISRAQAESRKVIEKAELSQRQIQKTVIQAQQQSYQDICQEMNRIKEEAEATRKSACESIARTQEESRLAREEAGRVKKESEAAISRAREETRKAREEAEQARQTLAEVVARTQEESLKLKEEVESSILMANEAMKLARQDIISMTIGEITRTRQALEAASKDPGILRYVTAESENHVDEEAPDSYSETPAAVKETVSPHKLITEAVQDAEGIARQKSNLIILSIPGTLPDIEADGTRIRQVLHNLITNAIKSSPENSAVTVRAEVRDGELLVQVKDRGTVIPPAEIAEVFDESNRGTDRGETDGPSVELDTCRQIIESHGGYIRMESAEGQGNTFSFTLPLAPMNS